MNPDSQQVSLFDLPEGPSSGSETAATPETTISLEKCVCRGRSDGIRISSQPQGQIRIQNSAFALDGVVVQNFGSTGMPSGNRSLDLSVLHATFVLTGPMLEIRDSDELSGRGPQRTLSLLNLTTEACVFASVVPESA